MAKGRDHDSVSALETYLKVIPWKIESVKTYATRLSTGCDFITILLMSTLLHNEL